MKTSNTGPLFIWLEPHITANQTASKHRSYTQKIGTIFINTVPPGADCKLYLDLL